MKEYYVLSSLCRRILSYSVWSQVREDQNRNNFQLDLSRDEICILVNLINKRLEELTNDKENYYGNN
uniref:Uncharacterized protein n=1 Tax=Siphoviridae sp. ctnpt50 TaxID=2827941 RepID=A0A8S5SEH7_9CAUD|nr:MAG TPA: hypothetical protein [Siphoviridae sp. ctnpt50]